MPNETTLALDRLWPDLLLMLGLVLVLGSGVAIALCALGGCLDFLDRRRAARSQQRLAVRPQPQIAQERIGSQPALHAALVEARRAAAEGDGLHKGTIQISEAGERSPPVGPELVIPPLTLDSSERAGPPLG
jgi:hypothetical protein